MTNRYYVVYPRDFVNEYTVFVVGSQRDEQRLLRALPSAERITRKRAIYLGYTRPNETRRTGEHWDGGFVRELLYPVRTLTDALANARGATRAWLDQIDIDEREHEDYLRTLDLDADVLSDEEFQQQVEDVISSCF